MRNKLFCVRRRIEYGRDYFVWAKTEEDADDIVNGMLDIDDIDKMEYIDDYVVQTDEIAPTDYCEFDDSDFINPECKPEEYQP